MVTAELAVAIPTLVVVLVLALGAVTDVSAQLRCADAAAVGARLAARGETTAAVVSAVRAVAPAGAQVLLTHTGDTVTVQVSAVLRLPFGPGVGPAVRVQQRFTMPREPGP